MRDIYYKFRRTAVGLKFKKQGFSWSWGGRRYINGPNGKQEN